MLDREQCVLNFKEQLGMYVFTHVHTCSHTCSQAHTCMHVLVSLCYGCGRCSYILFDNFF